MAKLKPCPFCGGKIRIIVCDDEGNTHDDEYENDPWSGLGYRLYHDITDCQAEKCPIAGHECEGEMGVWIYDTRAEAIEAWNKRTERPKGRWVLGNVKPGYFTPGGNRPWVCSECGEVVSWRIDKPMEKFCPNCGADMRGESE